MAAVGGEEFEFGIQNFITVLQADIFLTCLKNIMLLCVLTVPISTLLALLIAVCLNAIKPLQRFLQTIFFLPYVTNSIAIGMVFAAMFNIVGRPDQEHLVETWGLINSALSIFGIEPNDHAIYLDVKQYMANNRQGTHKSKERSEIAGSTRKLGRQKGGGGARPGDIKSPVRVGGGRIFGPVPRDYSFKLNKKVKQLARKSALSYKVQENALVIVEDFTFEAPKTKNYTDMLKNLKSDNKKSLLVLANQNKNVYLSARNLEKADVATVSELSTYRILNAKCLLLTENAVANLQAIFNA
jgi:large subunit ribosomal protein L4